MSIEIVHRHQDAILDALSASEGHCRYAVLVLGGDGRLVVQAEMGERWQMEQTRTTLDRVFPVAEGYTYLEVTRGEG